MDPAELKRLVEAGHPLISIESRDEPRALGIVRGAARALNVPVATWSISEGIIEGSAATSTRAIGAMSPTEALRAVLSTGHPMVYVFRDLGVHCRDPQVARHLRDLYFSPAGRLWTLVMVDAAGLPADIRRLTAPFEIGLPDAAEIEAVIRQAFADAKRQSLVDVTARLTRQEFDQLVHLLCGLTAMEAARVVTGSIHDDSILDGGDLPRIMAAKRNLLEATGSDPGKGSKT